MILEVFKHIYFRLPLIVRLLITILTIMIFFGTLIHFVEPNTFPTIFEGIWWAFVTGATVGFGDFVPHTTPGRVIGILLILSGGGMVTFYITAFSSSTIQHERQLSTGKIAFKGTDHSIFIGWNERTRHLVDMTMNKNAKREIVVIDNTVTSLPYNKVPVHFIHGDPTEDHTLKQANIEHAKNITISANIQKNEQQADNMTILTVVAVRGNNHSIRVVCEILSHRQIDNALRAGANTILRTNDFMSILFYHELFREKQATPFEDLSNLLNNQQFKHIAVPTNLINKTFLEATMQYTRNESILLGFIRKDTHHINPENATVLEHADILILLQKWK